MTSETKASRVLLAFLLVGAAAAAGGHDDAVARRTMEEFAGFPASDGGEGPSTAFRVDSEGLQRQVRLPSLSCTLMLCRAAGYHCELTSDN
jgi:ureidoglycolate amidohydrolase